MNNHREFLNNVQSYATEHAEDNQAVLNQSLEAESMLDLFSADEASWIQDALGSGNPSEMEISKTEPTSSLLSAADEEMRLMRTELSLTQYYKWDIQDLLMNIDDALFVILNWRARDHLNEEDLKLVNDFERCVIKVQRLPLEDRHSLISIEVCELRQKFMLLRMRQKTRACLGALNKLSIYDTIIKTMDLSKFNQLCDLIQSSAILAHISGSLEFWSCFLPNQKGGQSYFHRHNQNLYDLCTLITHPQMGHFFQQNILKLIKQRNEPLNSILRFLENWYTKELFIGEEGEYFCGELLKLSRGGLKTKLEIISRCHNIEFFVGEAKKTLVKKVLQKKGTLPELKEAIKFFSEGLKQSQCDPMDLLNALLNSKKPKQLIKILQFLPFKFGDLFPFVPKDELTLMHIINTESMYSKLNDATNTCYHLLFESNKKLLLSLKPEDVAFKFELLQHYAPSTNHVKSVLRKLCECQLLTTNQSGNLSYFMNSPFREVMGYVFLACDEIDEEIIHLVFLYAERICIPETLNTWQQIPADSLTAEHINHLVTLDNRELLITYLEQFYLGGEARDGEAVNINYDQSTHNSEVELSITESSKKLWTRYAPVLALTARLTTSSSDSIPIDSTASALLHFYANGDSSMDSNVLPTQHWNQQNSLCYAEMRQWLDSLPDEPFKPSFVQCFARIQKLKYIRNKSKVSMTTLFALIWILIHDDKLLSCSLDDALDTFKEMLYEIQRGYNIVSTEDVVTQFNLIQINGISFRDNGLSDNPICAGGTFNKGIEKFSGVHPDLQVRYKTFATATLKFQGLVKELAVEKALQSGNIDLMQEILEDGVGCIWEDISDKVKDTMLDEFKDLYQPQGENHREFVAMMRAAIFVDLSDSKELRAFIAQETVSSAKRSFGLFSSSSNEANQDEQQCQWRRLDDEEDREDSVAVNASCN